MTTTRSPRQTASRTLWVTSTIVLLPLLPDALQVEIKLFACHTVESGERLIHEKHARIGSERARERRALFHPAG